MLRHGCSFVAVAALFAVAAAAGEAVAHPRIFPNTESEQRAEELRKKGNALSREGRLVEAVDAYRSSFKISETYGVAANLGSLEHKLEQYRDAAEHLAFAIRMSPPNASPAVTDVLRKSLAEAKKHVSALRIRISVDGAVVTVDGAMIDGPELGFEVFVDPGAHAITATRVGYTAVRKVIEAAPGSLLEVELAPTPLTPLALPPAALAALTPLAPQAPEGDEGRGFRVPLIIGGAGVATIGAVLGVVFTVVANRKSSQATGLRDSLRAQAGDTACSQPSIANGPDCSKLYSLATSQSAFANAAAWSFVGGGAIALGTGAYALWPVIRGKPALVTALRVWPAVGARSGVMVVAADF